MATRREIEIARALRRRATPAERQAWELLRCHRCQGVKFKRQHPVAGFIVDFYAPQLKLVLELDGAVHDTPDQAEYDELRTLELEAAGLIVVRMRNESVNALSLAELVMDRRRSFPLSVAPAMERGSGGEAEPGARPDP